MIRASQSTGVYYIEYSPGKFRKEIKAPVSKKDVKGWCSVLMSKKSKK